MFTKQQLKMDSALDIIHFYPEFVDRMAYLREYTMNKFQYLYPEESMGPSFGDDIGYICQWTVDEFNGTRLYLITDKSLLGTYTTCEETPVSIFVWNDEEIEDFSNYDITRPLCEIFPYIEDALGWFAYISENHILTSKPFEITEKNKIITEEAETCAVCLEEYQKGNEMIKLTECKHIFCEPCISTWLKTNTTCPLCRTSCIN